MKRMPIKSVIPTVYARARFVVIPPASKYNIDASDPASVRRAAAKIGEIERRTKRTSLNQKQELRVYNNPKGYIYNFNNRD